MPQVTPPAGVRLIEMDLVANKASLLGGASGSGKTHAAIQSASRFVQQGKEGGCVMYHAVPRSANKEMLATAKRILKGQQTLPEPLPSDVLSLLAMMDVLDQKVQTLEDLSEVREARANRADLFVKYVETVANSCTTLFEDLKQTTEAIRVAVVLDDVGEKPYLEVAARSCSKTCRVISSSRIRK